MRRAAYVDVSNAPQKIRCHVFYDGEHFVKVRKMTMLSRFEKIFIDTLFPSIINELIDLADSGVEIYVLKDTRIIKKFRDELGLAKSDDNDAYVLSKIPVEFYRRIRGEELKLRLMLHEYEIVSKRLRELKKWSKEGIYEVEELKKLFETKLRKLSREITRLAEAAIPMYKEVSEQIGVNGVMLAGLLLYVDFNKGLSKIKSYLGLYEKATAYSKKARTYLSKLARAIAINAKNGNGRTKLKKYRKIVKESKNTKQAIKRIEIAIIKQIRKIFRETSG